MGASIYVKSAVGSETVKKPEGAVPDGKRVWKKSRVEWGFAGDIDMQGGEGVGKRAAFAWCYWKRGDVAG